jgi:uncharacterized protein YuzE
MGTTEATYLTVRPKALVDRQKSLTEAIILDLDEDGAVVGIETIGEHSPTEVLMAVLDKARF